MENIVDTVSNTLAKTPLSPIDELKSADSSETLADLGVFSLVLEETSVNAKQHLQINNNDIDGNTVPLLDNSYPLTAGDDRIGLPEVEGLEKQLDQKGSIVGITPINQENSSIVAAKINPDATIEGKSTNSSTSLVSNEVQVLASGNATESNNHNRLNVGTDKAKHTNNNVAKASSQNITPVDNSLFGSSVNLDNKLSPSLNREDAASDVKTISTNEIKNNISLARISLPGNTISNDLNATQAKSALVHNDTLNREEIIKDSIVLDNGNAVAKGSILTNQLRQLLQIDSKVTLNDTNVTSLHATKAGSDLNNNVLEKSIFQLTGNANVSTEQFELLTNKHNSNPTPVGQYSLLPNANAPLYSQTTPVSAIHVEHSAEGSQYISNPVINSFSSPNLQAVGQLAITESFGRPDWSQGLGKQVVMMVNQQLGSAQIRLNPAHLGPVEILIDMSDEQVSVSLTSRHSAVREAMELALPRLREMLDENGFNLSDADVSKHSLAQQREDKSHTNDAGLAANVDEKMASPETNENIIQTLSSATSVVDYYI